jgi:hypothetical protein
LAKIQLYSELKLAILKYFSTKFSSVLVTLGDGWAKPKNGEAHFWAWSWRCGVSEANTA